jgi:hypothetical protein
VRRALCLALSAVTALALTGCDTSKSVPTALRCEIRIGEESADSPLSLDSSVPLTVRINNYAATFSVVAAAHGQPRLLRAELTAPHYAGSHDESGLPTVNFPFTSVAATPGGSVKMSCRVDDGTTTTAHESRQLIIIVEPHDGDRVTQPWLDTQLVNSRLCRDGSTFSWTENAYWSSADDVFHARPGTNEITGPPKLVRECSPVQP